MTKLNKLYNNLMVILSFRTASPVDNIMSAFYDTVSQLNKTEQKLMDSVSKYETQIEMLEVKADEAADEAFRAGQLSARINHLFLEA